jgi:P27 family predicted phage terminase small subunit
MKQSAILKVVPTRRKGNAPPRLLGKPGMNLWNRITSEYAVEDAAGKELLVLACQSLDRAEAIRATIDHDGEVLTTRNGVVKEHPALRAELQSRAFCAKMLLRLGLDVEPIRDRPGRPTKVSSWIPDEE